MVKLLDWRQCHWVWQIPSVLWWDQGSERWVEVAGWGQGGLTPVTDPQSWETRGQVVRAKHRCPMETWGPALWPQGHPVVSERQRQGQAAAGFNWEHGGTFCVKTKSASWGWILHSLSLSLSLSLALVWLCLSPRLGHKTYPHRKQRAAAETVWYLNRQTSTLPGQTNCYFSIKHNHAIKILHPALEMAGLRNWSGPSKEDWVL